MNKLLDHGKVTRGYLGVVVQPISPAMARALGQSEPKAPSLGMLARRVPRKRAAWNAGHYSGAQRQICERCNETANTVSMMQPARP